MASPCLAYGEPDKGDYSMIGNQKLGVEPLQVLKAENWDIKIPLPADPEVAETGKKLAQTLRSLSGPRPGFRPGHAKGILLKGIFTPTSDAKALSRAQHFNQLSTPIIARFSSSTGNPDIPDSDPRGNPRGFAIRFQLAESPRRIHTDIIAHSIDGTPGSNGEEALGFFSGLKNGTLADYLIDHPKAAEFIKLPRPFPASFAHQRHFAVNTFKLVAASGDETYIRYRFEPVAGVQELSAEEAAARGENYLFGEIPNLLAKGPIEFKLTAQVAEEGDVTNDNWVKWPETRRVVELGTISLSEILEDNMAQQKYIIFDPIPRVDGVEASDDPLLQYRAAAYLISGIEHRSA
ncbi:catalase-like domain-containing protein [Xylogone sp. PMI_703]|nr:catalase-like domain-containing protein [Xylogone sp. PMI_703]